MKISLLLLLVSCLAILSVSAKEHSHHKSVRATHEYLRSLTEYVNSADAGWKAGVNERFKDVDLNGMKRLMGVKDVNPPVWERPAIKAITNFDMNAIPAEFDARTNWPQCKSIREIRDQSSCGSCWAFGAVEAASDRICIETNGQVQAHLSARDMLSCCTSCGYGCEGGYPNKAWEFLTRPGVVTGGNFGDNSLCQAYPFKCEKGSCPPGGYKTPTCLNTCDANSTYTKPYAQDKYQFATSYSISSNVAQIQQEIMTNGPVEVAFQVYEDFMTYKSGVYRHVTGQYLGGHAVKALGWGVENGQNYWLCANSWDETWGDKGYFKIAFNNCGIENYVVAGKYKK